MLTRKLFLAQLASGGWAAVLAGCGGGSDAAPAPSPAPSPGGVGSCSAVLITANHGHALSIPVADLTSAVAMSYNIQGSADHNHQVTFSPAQLASLRGGASVTVTSTTTLSHSHDLSETCT